MKNLKDNLTEDEKLALSLLVKDYTAELDLDDMHEGLAKFLKGQSKVQTAPARARTEVSHPSFGLLLASKIYGHFSLFDSPVKTEGCLRLKLSEAGFNPKEELGDKLRVEGGTSLWEVDLSGEQYCRFMNSSCAFVPCTISRSNGYSNDAPTDIFKSQIQAQNKLKKDIQAIAKPLSTEVSELISLINSTPLTTKKGLAVVREKFNRVKALHDTLQEQIIESKNEQMKSLLTAFSNEIKNHWELEARRLPAEARGKLYLPSLSNSHG